MPIEKGIVEYYGPIGGENKCGYCKKKKPPLCDFGMWAHQLTPFEYFHLMERGWRRSGKYLYKPINEKTCCPTYPIKCDVLNFIPSKSQKRVIRNVNKYLLDGVKPKYFSNEPKYSSNELKYSPKEPKYSPKDEDRNGGSSKASQEVSSDAQESVGSKSDQSRKERREREGRKKKKEIRIEKAVSRVMRRSGCDEEAAKKVAKEKHEMKMKRRIQSRVKSLEELMKLVERKDEKEREDKKEPAHKLQVKFVSTSFVHDRLKENEYFDSSLPTEHSLYAKYQTLVHGDDPNECTRKQFQRFLVDSPLIPIKLKKSIDVDGISHYGSYHMQFWLDEKVLIAVGVVDFVTLGWSSVYFFYDPDYNFLSLGTYSALREITMVRQIVTKMPEFKNYFMGYYIHSCPKMRYKGKFNPSYLLCPEAKTWWKLKDVVSKPIVSKPVVSNLDVSKYCRLDPDLNKKDEGAENIAHSDIEVLYSTNGMTNFGFYLTLKQESGDREEEESMSVDELNKTVVKVEEYAKLAGKSAVKSILLYLE